VQLVSIADIRAAAIRIAPTVRRTPMLDVTDLDGVSIALKCENLQRTGSFKLRGATNALSLLEPELRRRGVLAYSSGNHGQGVAYAARALGIPATIVMPENATTVKVEAARAYGAEVLFAGTTSIERQVRGEAEAAARGLAIIPPYDHPAIVAGAGTTGLEILEQRPDVTAIYIPMGGGGQISGVSTVIKSLRPEVRIIGVEPAGAARMTASLTAGHRVALDRSASIADGLLTLEPGELTFAHVQAHVDEIVTVDDESIRAAVCWLFRHAKLVAEPSGAASVAAVLAKGGGVAPGTVAIVSGGNVVPAQFAAVLAGTPAAEASHR
jgi:threonine dehydratase